ncbi:MAG TPA: hypothetical protein VM537_10780 [Anaerolineae bacterium]|nr:hypothetical protein [Anaerolineae bacterium]
MNLAAVRYVVITGTDEAQVGRAINDKIVEGWQPQGGISATLLHPTPGGPKVMWAQALVWYEL